jgi:hypothetical protein
MLCRFRFCAVLVLFGVTAACDSRHSPAAFHLPAGDIDRGKTAFVELGCHSCHEVPGAAVPAPAPHSAVPVKLGGVVDQRFSDGYLVTALLDPSYQLAPYSRDQVTVDGKSKMPCYTTKMSTQQMIDVVTFLQSRYSLRRWSPQYF